MNTDVSMYESRAMFFWGLSYYILIFSIHLFHQFGFLVVIAAVTQPRVERVVAPALQIGDISLCMSPGSLVVP